MDCKRLNKCCALKHLISILCIMALASCTWVKDDVDDCPYGFWLKLHYTYNILDVEAAPEYVKAANVYIYDTDGNFHFQEIKNYLNTTQAKTELQPKKKGVYETVSDLLLVDPDHSRMYVVQENDH